ncbi:MAG: hypothetical protein ABI016_07040 [Chthoniobacterales bacterium]
MSLRKRLLLLLLLVLLVGALDAVFSPFVVARGIRLWLGWAARQQGMSARVEKVEAPFLLPVTLRNLEFTSRENAGRQVSFRAETVAVDLNFRGWIFRRNVPFLRSIQADRLAGKVRVLGGGVATFKKLDWRLLDRLLPANFRITDLDLEVATETTTVGLRGVLLTASAVESGKFSAREISVVSPIFRQKFFALRGATSWEGNRLTIAGIPLARGLDLEALTFDLSRLTKRRLGLELHFDTFGGTLRASFQGRAGEKFALDVAGSAANISLPQISQALGFLEPVTGAVRASKFTFRGNPGEFLDGTASVWMELAGFSWRNRQADNVMLGATYYDRRLEVDQLYVRQSQNELTINGELSWPKKRSEWARLPFRGLLNASIPDLNSFAQLFGATTGDFTGALLAEGQIDSLASEAQGQITFHGAEVKFRGVTVDSLGASLQLKGSEVTVENLEARHAEDFLRGAGTIDLAAAHHFSGRLTGAISDLSAYAPLLPASWRAAPIAGGATFDWRGDGTLAAHSGTMQLFAHGLQLPVAPLRRPLDLTLEGSYSPQDFFFRTFKVANEKIALGGFLMLGSNFLELQALEFTLEGTPRASGTIFLPVSLNRWRTSGSLLAAFDEEQKFDVDLKVDHLDLVQLAAALGEKTRLGGVLDGKLAAFGRAQSLQVATNWRLENFGSGKTDNAIDLQGRYAEGRAEVMANATFGVSAPVVWQASLPLRLEKDRLADGSLFTRGDWFSSALDYPALFLDSLPNELRFGAREGLLSGRVAWSGTLATPAITGEASIINARFQPPAPWPELTGLEAKIDFATTEAVVLPLRFMIDSKPVNLRARLTTSPPEFRLTVRPLEDEIELVTLPPSGTNLSCVRLLGQGSSPTKDIFRSALLRGRLGSPAFSLTIASGSPDEEASSLAQTTLFIRPDAEETEPLLLRAASPEPPVVLELRPPPRFIQW